MNPIHDTIIAPATAQGVAAIAVIRLSGEAAISITDHFFCGKDLLKAKSHTIHFGTIKDENKEVIDEVLVSIFIAPRSYTKENVVEISCHGSSYIVQKIIELFLRQGVRLAKPGEFTQRAYLNGQLDLSQAEAVADLIAADSEAQHKVAMQQMRGGYSVEIKKLREQLIHFAALIELELDFGEEDVEFADRTQLKGLVNTLMHFIQSLIDSFQMGNAIKTGVNTVIAGRPNAGKSTLLNVLLNDERAIVSDIAGTTRDLIEEILYIQGIPFRIIDTAGIREATDKIEAIGVAKALEKIKQSAILIYVYDASTTSAAELKNDLNVLSHDLLNIIVVANKCDLLNYQPPNSKEWEHMYKNYPFVFLSARNKEQIPKLQDLLFETIQLSKQTASGTIISNARHFQALTHAYAALNRVIVGIDSHISGDFVAMDIRHAQRQLTDIIGDEISSDDILENIFSNFCIGK